MDNIIFIGMPAAGKSTIGVVAAKRLGYSFLDVDLLIQEKEKKLLHEIIEERGTEGFHRINAQVEAEHCIISPGGSVVYCKNAMEHYKRIGKVVYLQVSYETIKDRIGDPHERGVALRDGQTLRELYEERRVLFEKYADITICEDGLTLEETIGKVLNVLEK